MRYTYKSIVNKLKIDEMETICSLEPDLLQLQEMAPFAPKSGPQIVDDLFSTWLSLPETGRLVRSLIDDAKFGLLCNSSGRPHNPNAVGSESYTSTSLTGRLPPLSPGNSPPKSKRKNSHSSLVFPLKLVREPMQEVIPQFYFKCGRPPSKSLKEHCLSRINHFFNNPLGGLDIDEFKSVVKKVCKLPSFFSSAMFKKIDIDCNGLVTRDAFAKYWVESNMLTMDIATQIFNILKEPDCKYLTKADFKPVLLELLETHPGLDFLGNSPEFHARYAETVIYRIFYYTNISGNGHLTLGELKRGNIIEAMQHVDEEDDVNEVLRYFSYEHFYVVFCKFWEIDTDHDFLIGKGDLFGYANDSLSCTIVERIFSEIPRKFTSKVKGKMGYEDFVYFIFSEEDKSSAPSLNYWFKCIDMDENGVITPDEISYFYEEQRYRMRCLGQTPVLFVDILCQISDMIKPKRDCHITLRDIKGSKLSGAVFNILFNLRKFIEYETRDPSFSMHEEENDQALTEWDCFARREYKIISIAEDTDNTSSYSSDNTSSYSSESSDSWEESPEHPF